MATGRPASRKGRAMSRARGYWLDWTPTRATIPKLLWRRNLARSAGKLTRVLVSSIAMMSMATFGSKHLALRAVNGDAVKSGERI